VAIDPRTPVIVGVGQSSQRDTPDAARPPLELWADAARAAQADSGVAILSRLDAIVAVSIVSWWAPDQGAALAQLLGIEVPHTAVTSTGGNSPQMAVNHYAARIATGEFDAVMIGGAEAVYTRWRARREPRVELAWPTYDVAPCSNTVGDERPGSNEFEHAHGLVAPVNVYPLFETALRAKTGRSVDEHQMAIAELWSHFSEVAATNPYAWNRRAYTPEEIATTGPDNRAVVFPYVKRMCANIDVDQAATVILCAYETAKAAGVADDRLVFLHAGADAADVWWVSERADLTRSPAIAAMVRNALAHARIGIDDVARFDLYSCFPSAVQMSMAAIGLAGPAGGDQRPLTTTGGLPYAGGPVNNYATHGIATMAEALRADPGSFGLTTALGWYVTKHSTGVWSTTPPAAPYSPTDPAPIAAEVARDAAIECAGAWGGAAVVEATAVEVDRDGAPTTSVVSVRLPDGRRTLANTTDGSLGAAMMAEAWEGRTVDIRTDGTRNTLAI
jgi:acetyl-CoA C-acetyltransferase